MSVETFRLEVDKPTDSSKKVGAALMDEVDKIVEMTAIGKAETFKVHDE
jgi:hypothetical protein